MLIMPEFSLPETGKLAGQLRLRISEDFGIDHNGQKLKITASLGVASFPDHGDNINKILTAASRAIYRAKSSGRNRVVVL